MNLVGLSLSFQDVTYHFVQCHYAVDARTCSSLSSHLGYQIDYLRIAVFVFKQLLFYLIMVPKLKSNGAGESDMPKRSHKVLPLSEKIKVLELIKKDNQLYAEVAKI